MMAGDSSSLILDVRPGEKVRLAGAAEIELVHKSGKLARLRIVAERDVKIEKTTQTRTMHGNLKT